MRLVLGLGNPGPEYAGTRHNVGFDVVGLLARRHGIAVAKTRHRAQFGTGSIGGVPVMLAIPLTYMNLSGEAARPLMSYHGIEMGDLIVVHDEADLPPGTVRIKRGGGLAGHKGLVSLEAHLGTRDFVRIRIGIGRPPSGGADMADYVLARARGEDGTLLGESVVRGAEAVEAILASGVDAAMRSLHGP